MSDRDKSSLAKEESSPEHPFVSDFLSHLIRERRLSPHTAEGYRHDVGVLLELAQGTALQDLQIHQIRRFIARLHGRGLGGKSLGRMLSAWRGFFHYLARDHGFTRNPCSGVRPPSSGIDSSDIPSPTIITYFIADPRLPFIRYALEIVTMEQ